MDNEEEDHLNCCSCVGFVSACCVVALHNDNHSHQIQPQHSELRSELVAEPSSVISSPHHLLPSTPAGIGLGLLQHIQICRYTHA